jgi:hypothetical protein
MNVGFLGGKRQAENGLSRQSRGGDRHRRSLGAGAWSRAKSSYVAGEESYLQLAQRLGVCITAVEKRADRRHPLNLGRSWNELRTDYRQQVCAAQTEASKRIEVQASMLVAVQHAELLGRLASASREVAVDAFRELKPRDRVMLALAVIAMERRVHGLDRSPVQLEVAGKDGKPIEHDLTIDFDVDTDARALAQRTLEALFGETSSGQRSEGGRRETALCNAGRHCTTTNASELQTESGI